jgi:uncharacterized iron-regulated membrane protein
MAGTSRRPRLRRILRMVHLWLGLSLGIPLALIGASGSILVFEQEIAGLFDGTSQPEFAVGEPQPLSAIVQVARTHVPADAKPALFVMPDERGEPATLRFTRPGSPPGPNSALTVRIDPVSLAVVEPRAPTAAQQWLRQIFLFHANLLGGREGREWVGRLGIVLCFFGISGLIMWWPRPQRWRKAFGVSKGARGVWLYREVHGAAGFWCLSVFLMISFSGVYIVFPETTGELVRTALPGRDVRAAVASLRVQPLAGGPSLDVDGALDLARREAPGLDLRMAGFPARPDQPYRMAFDLPGTTPGHGVPMVAVFVDPWAGEIVDVQDPRSFTVGETVSIWQRALHGGAGLGWVWKILTFLSGLLPILFAVTGICMWWLRRRRKRRATLTAGHTASASPAE